jgi:FkbM family methyltransferase
MNLGLNSCKNVIARNVALGDRVGSAGIVYRSENTGGTHVVTSVDRDQNMRHAHEACDMDAIATTTLDTIGMTDIDLLIVDIEGFEDRFVEGAKRTLMTYTPPMIIEIWSDTKRKFENMPASRDDTVRRIMDLGYASCHMLSGDDYLFLPKDTLSPNHRHCPIDSPEYFD